MSKYLVIRAALLTEKQLAEPFADYKDFADCMAKNKDKGDPKGYCATIKRKAEG